jgi:hypothetical protein
VRISNNRVLRLGSFFLTKLWNDADLVSIGELQLLWIDSRGPNTPLASLRLYFLPENTPDGRRDTHGEVSPYVFSLTGQIYHHHPSPERRHCAYLCLTVNDSARYSRFTAFILILLSIAKWNSRCLESQALYFIFPSKAIDHCHFDLPFFDILE